MTDDRIEDITAEEFWGYYFSGTARTMTRSAAGMTAAVPAEIDPAKKSILDAMLPGRNVRVSRASLEDYYYRDDPRFARIESRTKTLEASLAALEKGVYDWRMTPPLAKEQTVRQSSDLLAEITEPTLDALLSHLTNLLDSIVPDARDEALAAIWLIGEQHDVSSGPTLISALGKITGGGMSADVMGSTGRDTVLTALFQSNPKVHIAALLDVMDGMGETDRFKLRQLLIALFSQDQSLGEPALPEGSDADYQNPEFWAKLKDDTQADYWRETIDGIGITDQEGWDRYDARALHWELRWLSALRSEADNDEALKVLAGDEVATVAEKARTRLSNR